MNNIQPVIMAGGFGTRLWPMSNEVNSKQFLKIFAGKSLFQLTLLRNIHLGKPIVIINTIQKDIAQIQIEEISCDADIIIEPLQKNTASCAIIAAIYTNKRNKTKVALFPSDHYVSDHEKYKVSLIKAINALEHNNICTIGIRPTTAHTGYGYIQVEENINDNASLTKKFIEKPSLDLATQFFNQPNYYWNSGMLFYDANFMLSMSSKFIPHTLEMIQNSEKNSVKENSHTLLAKEHYEKISPISIDHAILQNLSNMAFLEATFDWRDIGSWDSLWNINKKDCNMNHIEGNVLASEVTNSFIKSDGLHTTVIGLSDIIVISNGSNILVASKDKSEELKNILSKNEFLDDALPLPSNKNSKDNFDCRLDKYIINQGDTLTINKPLNNQNWLVLKGKVNVVINEIVKKLEANSSIHITKDQKYYFHNIGKTVARLVKIS